MNRIVKINLNDILIDAKRASETINEACRRKPPGRVVGCCRTTNNLLVFLESTSVPTGEVYNLAQFPSTNEAEVVAEVNARHFAGFTTIGGIDVDDAGKWGLFAVKTNAAGVGGAKSDE